jgi:hypothetical protein
MDNEQPESRSGGIIYLRRNHGESHSPVQPYGMPPISIAACSSGGCHLCVCKSIGIRNDELDQFFGPFLTGKIWNNKDRGLTISAELPAKIPQPTAVLFELQKESADAFGRVTGANIGKKLAVVFHNKILTAPTIRESIGDGKIKLDGGKDPFWRQAPWLKDLIEDSYRASRRSVMVYVIVALAIAISAFVFILLPRMKPSQPAMPE